METQTRFLEELESYEGAVVALNCGFQVHQTGMVTPEITSGLLPEVVDQTRIQQIGRNLGNWRHSSWKVMVIWYPSKITQVEFQPKSMLKIVVTFQKKETETIVFWKPFELTGSTTLLVESKEKPDEQALWLSVPYYDTWLGYKANPTIRSNNWHDRARDLASNISEYLVDLIRLNAAKPDLEFTLSSAGVTDIVQFVESDQLSGSITLIQEMNEFKPEWGEVTFSFAVTNKFPSQVSGSQVVELQIQRRENEGLYPTETGWIEYEDIDTFGPEFSPANFYRQSTSFFADVENETWIMIGGTSKLITVSNIDQVGFAAMSAPVWIALEELWGSIILVGAYVLQAYNSTHPVSD